MLAEAQSCGSSVNELVAWACINMTALRQRNAIELLKQWMKNGRRADKLEPNDIPKLIRKVGHFDTMNEDSQFNLDRMVQMPIDATERDERHNKSH